MRDSCYVNQNCNSKPTNQCKPPTNKGLLLRVFIPAGAVINLLNLIEVSSPSGICLIVRIPLLGGDLSLNDVMDRVKAVGGACEVIRE